MAALPKAVEKLVERYQRERKTLESVAYGEADTRKEFIEPLFTALGWDVANRAMHSEAYKDVVNEYSLKIGDTHKAPDYVFRVGGNRVFFVEAKRPGIDVSKDAASAYQLRRYGWTAKLPISILANFRYLAVYDCTRQPSETDKANAARTLLIPWETLPERWAELSDLLGKTAVLQGSLQRYFDEASRRRGTFEVDDLFLRQMEDWRERLAKDIAKNNPSLSVDELNEAVQQTLDRIVFLRIAEDRGIEPYGKLHGLLKTGGIYKRLIDVFRAADTRYNSGLFHFKAEKSIPSPPDKLTPTLDIGDNVLNVIISSMYYPVSPYEFSVLSADILGQVYEQFLGRVIVKSPTGSVEVVEKPEVRRSGGVYYTPTSIVRHIVEKTLEPALDGKTIRAARNIKVLDPACGSGSFLLGAFDYLMEWFLKAHQASGTSSSKQALYQDKTGQLRLTLEERKRILTTNIYGVDIDRQAVEVTKLSLMLKVLEGETDETMNSQLKMFDVERALPDLARNIVCGNSLVDSTVGSVVELSAEEEFELNPFDWPEGFPEAWRSKGFHAVIGNPPYDVIEKDRGAASWPHDKLRAYIPSRTDFEPALGGKLNLYRFFLVQSCELVRPGGYMGMIVPLGLAADITTSTTRKYLFRSLAEPSLDCFPQKDNRNKRIFRDAKLSTVVVYGKKSDSRLDDTNKISTRVFPGNSLNEKSINNQLGVSDLALLNPETMPVPLVTPDEWSICIHIHRAKHIKRLAELSSSYFVSRGEINQTTFARYIREETSGKSYAKLLKGVEVGAFEFRESLSQGEREVLDESALTKEQPRKAKPKGPRIATQRITGVDERQRLICAIAPDAVWFADSTNSIALIGSEMSLEYLTAVLNSDLMQWRFRLTSTNNNVGTNELLDLPVAVADPGSPGERKMLAAVEKAGNRVATLKLQLRTARSASAVERTGRMLVAAVKDLNQAVYRLYDVDEPSQQLIAQRLAVPAPDISSQADDD